MNTNEELKPDQPGYKYAQLKKDPTRQDVIDYLKAENDKLKKFKDYVHNQRDLKSENQKLRDLLKDAHETLIVASLIDKSNTCRDSAARIDAFLKTNP